MYKILFFFSHYPLHCIIIFSSFILAILIKSRYRKPFKYPYINITFDISGKRQPIYKDYIDEWINNLSYPDEDIQDEFASIISEWEYKCHQYLSKHILGKYHWRKLYKKMKAEILQDDYKIFRFIFLRNQTRYTQNNYRKEAYIVQNEDNIITLSLQDMLAISNQLSEIGYETTRTKWESKEQRKLMTKELRAKIKIRDNFTCQICGKYMPDEVGLHIDHIIPIKEGGKTIESNLQVLCDKCNLKKGKKIN